MPDLPQYHLLVENLPESADIYWEGFAYGVFSWTLQTYLRLQATGFPCKLVSSMPEEGIVLTHRDCLPDNLQPGSRLLIVCLQADRKRHPYAQLHIVQNAQAALKKSVTPLWDNYYIPHWFQPGLIPRHPERGDRFENIAFFGKEENLAPELKQPSWNEQLQALGLSWHIVSSDKWNDYSYVDAVLAVRELNIQATYTSKPATKLYNAWQAGVPAILGCDSAF